MLAMALFSWIVRRKRDFLIEFVDPDTERLDDGRG
jgi:hypothetical protein